MSEFRSDPPRAGPAEVDPARFLFQHEIRRDGRVVVTLQAHRTAAGVTVESEVFPISRPAGEPGVTRPFTFSTPEHARRFADEALVALEYLNCSVA